MILWYRMRSVPTRMEKNALFAWKRWRLANAQGPNSPHWILEHDFIIALASSVTMRSARTALLKSLVIPRLSNAHSVAENVTGTM